MCGQPSLGWLVFENGQLPEKELEGDGLLAARILVVFRREMPGRTAQSRDGILSR
jgi:hypothetical protein